MRSRIATAATVAALIVGAGGAIAVGAGGSSAGVQGGAAAAQYKPHKGCGKAHSHPGKKCPKPKPKKPPKPRTLGKSHRQPSNRSKPKKAHKPAAKKQPPRSSNCKITTVGQSLIAYCPAP